MSDFKKKITNSNKTGKSNKNKPIKKENSLSKKKYFIPILIFIFSFLIYANTIKNNYAFDDDIICLKNQFVQSKLHNVKEIFTHGFTYGFNGINTDYRPLTLLSTAIEVGVYGNKPHRHHFINVLLFSLSCVVLYLLLRKIFINYNFILPLIITLLYSAHPIHTEVVANIKGRDEILCFLFLVLSIYFMLKYFEKKNIFNIIMSSFFYLFSLLSKESAATFFIIFPMVIFYFTKTTFKKSLLFSIPFLSILLIYLLIRHSVIDAVTISSKIEIANNSLMAASSYSDRIATAFSMFGKYLSLLLFPVTLLCDYSFNTIPVVSWLNPKAFLSFIIFAGAFIYAVVTLPKKNYFSFAILFFILTFFITSNFLILINSSMAERFLFTPSLGFCIIIGLALVKFLKIDVVGIKKNGLNTLYLILGATIILYSFRTINRNSDWRDSENLFKTDVANSPNSFRLHYAYGSELRQKADNSGDPTLMKDLLTQALSEYKQSNSILAGQGEVWYNIGVCYYELNDFENAKHSYQRCLEFTPEYSSAFNNLGVIFFNYKNYDSAYFYFNKIIKINPNNADAIANIGAIMQTKGNTDEAIKYYEKALALNPGNINVYNNLIVIYTAKKDDEKIKYYKNKLATLK